MNLDFNQDYYFREFIPSSVNSFPKTTGTGGRRNINTNSMERVGWVDLGFRIRVVNSVNNKILHETPQLGKIRMMGISQPQGLNYINKITYTYK